MEGMSLCSSYMWSCNNVFTGIAEGAEFQFLSRPVVSEEKSEQILGSFEVKPSTENEVTYCVIS
jgi:hypothetical protein